MLLLCCCCEERGRREREEESVRRPTSAFRIFAAVTRDRQPDRRTKREIVHAMRICLLPPPPRRRNKFGDETRARDDKKRVRRRRTRTRTCDVPWSRGFAGMAVARFNGPLWKHQKRGMEEEMDVFLDPFLSIIFRQRKRDQSYNVPRSP